MRFISIFTHQERGTGPTQEEMTKMGKLVEEGMKAGWLIATEGVHFEHAWLDPESGTVFCLSSGPSKEAVRRVHAKAGHPTREIYELSVEVQ